MKIIEKAPAFDAESFDASALSDPALSAKVKEYNERYLHWSEVRYRTEDESELSTVWNAMKFTRNLSAQRLNMCGKTLSFCMIPQFTELLHYIDRDAAGRIETRLSGKKDAKRYLVSSLIEEAIASSQMEGAATTRKVAKKMLASKRRPENKDELMILNNYLAMEGIKNHTEEGLTPGLILEMHRTIVAGTLRDGEEWEGRFRERDDIVVGDPLDESRVYHVPPTHDGIPAMIDQLCEFTNNESDPYIHPIIKAIILHYLIGYIHPFVDGNGRLARSLFYWYCIRNGYWLFEYASISSVIKKSKGKYSYAYQFTESDGDDLTYFIRFNLECIRKSVDELTDYMDRKAEEQKSALGMIEKDGRLSLFEATLLKDMMRDGDTVSIREVQNRYDVVYQTARKYVQNLADLGYLTLAGKKGKQQFYTVSWDFVNQRREGLPEKN